MRLMFKVRSKDYFCKRSFHQWISRVGTGSIDAESHLIGLIFFSFIENVYDCQVVDFAHITYECMIQSLYVCTV